MALPFVTAYMLLAACGSHPTPPPPPPGFNFTVASQYTAMAQLDQTHTEKITFTFGRPMTVKAYAAAHELDCNMPRPEMDTAIPFHLQVVNTSASPTLIGVNVVIAVDVAKIKGDTAAPIQSDNAATCLQLLPARNDTLDGAVPGSVPQAWEPQAFPDEAAAAGQAITYSGFIGLTSGNNPPPPASAVFLRLDTTDGGSPVVYAITRMNAWGGQAGYSHTGPDAGVYYIPLDPGTSPCGGFDTEHSLKCGKTLP